MICQQIEFFNVDELRPVEGFPGLRLYRYPKALAESLGEPWQHNARFRAQRVHGCELRFVTPARCFDLALTAYEQAIDVQIFRGDRLLRKDTLPAGQTTVLHIDVPAMEEQVNPAVLTGNRFPSHVWRVLCGMNGYLHFNGLDTYGWACRPPAPEEEPSVRWLAYGSSITCGSVTTVYSNAYINQAARRLGWDVLNKGLSGSCFWEEKIADYLAEQQVDYMTLEAGVNMAPSFDCAEYARRVQHLLETVKRNQSVRRFFVIDSFPCYGLFHKDRELPAARHYEPFKQVTRRLTQEAARTDDRFVSLHGESILRDTDGLSCDLLHPSDEGHILMGQALAEEIQKYL
ncbi:MAG: hypothetical protein HDT33_03720 [Clostridiales bacterium]|nr:hypothetical protein [Clostridiales bacterium]